MMVTEYYIPLNKEKFDVSIPQGSRFLSMGLLPSQPKMLYLIDEKETTRKTHTFVQFPVHKPFQTHGTYVGVYEDRMKHWVVFEVE
jgi:hypothetical protein